MSSRKPNFKPLTWRNLVFYYFPLTSAASYATLAVNIANPILQQSIKSDDTVGLLMLHALCGAPLYIYNKPQMWHMGPVKRAICSLLGGCAFLAGSIFAWTFIATFDPNSNSGATMAGLVSVVVFLKCLEA